MDEKEYKGIEDILQMRPVANKYDLWGIKFNPFPRSGTSNINGCDDVNPNCKLASDLHFPPPRSRRIAR